jgi:hypothetical protein
MSTTYCPHVSQKFPEGPPMFETPRLAEALTAWPARDMTTAITRLARQIDDPGTCKPILANGYSGSAPVS